MYDRFPKLQLEVIGLAYIPREVAETDDVRLGLDGDFEVRRFAQEARRRSVVTGRGEMEGR